MPADVSERRKARVPDRYEVESPINCFRRSLPIEELERKARKATRVKQNIWTVEELEYHKAEAAVLAELFRERENDRLVNSDISG